MLVEKVATSSVFKEHFTSRLFKLFKPHIKDPLQTFSVFPHLRALQLITYQSNNVLP